MSRRDALRSTARAWGALLAALALSRGAAALTLDVDSSTMAPCLVASLCVDVSARISGTTTFGAETFSLPLPIPDPSLWVARSGFLAMPGSISIFGTYDTAEVLARHEPGASVVLMGVYAETLAFVDSTGTSVADFSIVQTMLCGVPGSDAGPTFACSDGNGGGGHRTYGPDALGWAQAPLTLQVGVSSTPPLPIAGTERIDVRNPIFVQVVYDPVPEPASLPLLALGLGLTAGYARARRRDRACARAGPARA